MIAVMRQSERCLALMLASTTAISARHQNRTRDPNQRRYDDQETKPVCQKVALNFSPIETAGSARVRANFEPSWLRFCVEIGDRAREKLGRKRMSQQITGHDQYRVQGLSESVKAHRSRQIECALGGGQYVHRRLDSSADKLRRQKPVGAICRRCSMAIVLLGVRAPVLRWHNLLPVSHCQAPAGSNGAKGPKGPRPSAACGCSPPKHNFR